MKIEWRQKMIYAVGDIHGCKKALMELIDKIHLTTEDTLVFLGDYIDRGPDSKGVIEFLLDLSVRHEKTIFIKGNHEWMFQRFYTNRDPNSWELWEYNGARKTIETYGDIDKIPREHLEFIENTKLYHVEKNFFFVHGGVKPNVEIEAQKEEDMLWIRDEFIYSKNPLNGYVVVFGHTPMEEPLIQDDKIGIDTGCVYGGKLSCVRLEDKKIFQVRCRN
jgi:serine/threonine protein phosphatase 1